MRRDSLASISPSARWAVHAMSPNGRGDPLSLPEATPRRAWSIAVGEVFACMVCSDKPSLPSSSCRHRVDPGPLRYRHSPADWRHQAELLTSVTKKREIISMRSAPSGGMLVRRDGGLCTRFRASCASVLYSRTVGKAPSGGPRNDTFSDDLRNCVNLVSLSAWWRCGGIEIRGACTRASTAAHYAR